jgi:hypothetical protein
LILYFCRVQFVRLITIQHQIHPLEFTHTFLATALNVVNTYSSKISYSCIFHSEYVFFMLLAKVAARENLRELF